MATQVISTEQSELRALIFQHFALTNALSMSDSTSDSYGSIVEMLKSPNPSKLPSVPKIDSTPHLKTVRGSRIHTYSKKDAPYPLSYDRAVLDSDICDRITLKSLCENGLTLCNLPEEPKSVLDLACGSGSFIIEAAATLWKNAELLVGFDLVNIQPASALLHDRIRWVQGNILDGLPFETGSFDYVRICRLAMGIPENKWSQVLEEVYRVLRPGGALEVVEEDIIFPFRPAPESMASTPPSVSAHGDLDNSSGSSAAGHSVRSAPHAASGRRPISIMVPKTLNPRMRSRSLGYNNVQIPSVVQSVSTMPTSSGRVSLASQEEFQMIITNSDKMNTTLRDPRDHTILHRAWEQMLDDRFISANPTSLLSFYLSLHFSSVHSHEPIQVLAPRSTLCGTSTTLKTTEGMGKVVLTPMTAAPSTTTRRMSDVFVTKDAGMHLRQCMQVVLGCEQALWEQVHKMHPAMTWDTFKQLLRDFELDMLDRIDTRAALESGIGWYEKSGRSDLEEWRARAAKFPVREDSSPLVCRIIRGFVAYKESS
ncbi:hypothetical protein PIIN_04710 [Serendipita indica DSM 11827]|uniref:Methyltransferase domain-containing protein n=1 Tax=Serendipita indica (strain DSM 11827) TaxID=1109443 RepID=G4THI2_SERID|nr:hypothetical protein PIIN_04710 [Serendipita indica DSM 11827]